MKKSSKNFHYFEDDNPFGENIDYIAVYDTSVGEFVSEPVLVREGELLKVETEINIDLEKLVEIKSPSLSDEDKKIATKNLEKLLNRLTYVIVDPTLTEEVVQVKLILGKEGKEVVIKTKKGKIIQKDFQGPFVHIKFNSTFNNHEFFWDDTIVAWLMADLFPELSKSTIDFWYRLQVKEGRYKGLIPREIRPENVAKNINTTAYTNIVNPVSYLPLTSLQVSASFLLSEVELELYAAYKDKERLEKVYPLLKNYFFWVEQNRKKVDEDTKCVYYEFSNLGSGMDNIMRGYGLFNPELRNYGWVDLFSQQVFLAQDLEKMEEILGIQKEFKKISEELKQELLRCHFDYSTELFWDRDYLANSYVRKPRTIAPFWVLLVEFNKDERRSYLNGLLTMLRDTSEFGGYPPLPSVSRKDELFNPVGNYWQGGVWPPMVWVVIKGLEKNGFRNDAQILRGKMYRLMKSVFEENETVFEYYAPSLINGKASPGFYNKVEAKKDFWGWGALIIPLSLENQH